MNVFSLLYGNTLKQSVLDKKIEEKETLELKKINTHYLDDRADKTKNTQFKVEDVFGHISGKNGIWLKQTTKKFFEPK